ncbi:MAG: peptidylprolyl isomerase [Kiritimatiellae bacterium]|nr:peptidylprolyl isomerase [Kiritimatiellia bacterium]
MFLFPVSSRSQDAMVVDGVAAHVNKHVVTMGEILEVVERVRPQLMANYKGKALQAQLARTYKRALNSIIERLLVVDAYNAGDAKLPPWVLEQRVEQHIVNRYNGDRSELLGILVKEDQTYEEWEEEFEHRMIVALMRSNYVEQNIEVSPLAIQQQFEENLDKYRVPPTYRVSMIQVMPKEDDVADARQRAEDAHARIVAGEAFADVAKAVSDDKRAESGGDWGWVKAHLVRPVLRETLLKLKNGQTSGIVHADGVFYIMHLVDSKQETDASFETMQPLIERELRTQASEELYAFWLNRLRGKAYIKVFDAKP